ncbi:MAG: hypothetical protein GKC53_00450 [Neisseriaceae bacterium]|nr:MAG: hypothetical protein GKC53_00450 [Neisseriaceae bacterium]
MSDNNTIIEIEIEIDEHRLSIQTPKKELEALNQSVNILNNALYELAQYQHVMNSEKRLILASLNIIRNLTLHSSIKENCNKDLTPSTVINENLLIEKNVLAIQLARTMIELNNYKANIHDQNYYNESQNNSNQLDLTLNVNKENSRITRMVERCRSALE